MLPRVHRFWAVVLACILLAGCDSHTLLDYRTPVALSQSSARPFEVVEITGLDTMFAREPQGIRVGEERTFVLFNPETKRHAFSVPFLSAGAYTLRLPADAADGDEVSLALQVLEPRFAGGSAQASLDRAASLLDSARTDVAFAVATLDPATDGLLIRHLSALQYLDEKALQAIEQLSPAQKDSVAAFLSANMEMIEQTKFLVSAIYDEIKVDNQGYIQNNPSVPSIPSALHILQQCQRFDQQLINYEKLQERFFIGSLALTTLATIASGPVGAAVGIVSIKTSMALSIGALILNSTPRYLDSQGIRIIASPSRINNLSANGSMTAYVHLVAAGGIVGPFLDLAVGIKELRDAIRGINEAMSMTRSSRILDSFLDVSEGIGFDAILSELDNMSRNFVSYQIGRFKEHTQVTFDGLSVASDAPSAWAFTGTSVLGGRLFRLSQTTPRTVRLTATLGSGAVCRASSEAPQPEKGINGFVVQGGGNVTLSPPDPVTVRAGARAVASLTVRNEGTEAVSSLTYRLGDGAALWVPPAGISATLSSGPTQLVSQASGSVSLTLAIDPGLPARMLQIPVSVLQNGAPIATAFVSVATLEQLSDLTVNAATVNLRIWDHRAQDGDRISLSLNGTTILADLSITNAGQTFAIPLRRGQNILLLTALNEGSSSPNTAALSLSNVTGGTSIQYYELNTGDRASLVITYSPSPSSGSPEITLDAPSPVLQPCSDDARGCEEARSGRR